MALGTVVATFLLGASLFGVGRWAGARADRHLRGPLALPFQGGTLCVQPPLKRGPLQNSGGSAPPATDCSGTFDLDVDAYAATPFALPGFQVPGTTFHAQWWGRDPGFAAPNNTQLSNAIEFTMQ